VPNLKAVKQAHGLKWQSRTMAGVPWGWHQRCTV